jgi:hypothetical protein
MRFSRDFLSTIQLGFQCFNKSFLQIIHIALVQLYIPVAVIQATLGQAFQPRQMTKEIMTKNFEPDLALAFE